MIDRINKLFERENEYGKKFILEELNDEMVTRVENFIGHKLPVSYVELLKEQNGGIIKDRMCWLTQIYGIGKTADVYNGLEDMIENWIGEWGYPQIGIPFGQTQSAGHDMYFMDYRTLNQDGEPIIVLVDNEGEKEDIVIKHVANSFEEFIQMVLDQKDIMGDVVLQNNCVEVEMEKTAALDFVPIEKKELPGPILEYYNSVNGARYDKSIEFVDSKYNTRYSVIIRTVFSFEDAKCKYVQLIEEEPQLADYWPVASMPNEKDFMLVKIKKRNKGKVYLWNGVFGSNVLAFDSLEDFFKELETNRAE